MKQRKIACLNKIAPCGLELFGDNYSLTDDLSVADAWLVRSANLLEKELPDPLRAIARAGAGVNNIPIQRCSEEGIVVFNTPGANANAVKELVMAGMLLATRGILPGMAYVNSLTDMTDAAEMHALLEKDKARFAGGEIKGKTLGIVGLGAIGSMVADMALAMGMKVVGFDPALAIDAAWRLDSSVQRMENLSALMARSDYISLHVPALEATKHMVNAAALAQAKPTAVLLNFARETIVDSAAVKQSLDAGKLAYYVCDFPEPAMLNHPKVIAMPHIGASTEESEENCAVMAANQLMDYLENGNIVNSVNFPAVSMGRVANSSRITFSNDNVSGVLGHVLSVLADKKVNVIDMMNKSRGELAFNIIDVETKPTDDVVSAIAAVEHVIRVRVI